MVQLNNNAVLSSDKYRIEKLLGQGGFGITYKAIMKETVSGSLGNMEVVKGTERSVYKALCPKIG